jgi:hypothetical protein
MSKSMHDHPAPGAAPYRRWSRGGALAFGGFLLIAAFLLFSEHRAHLFGWLPFLLLAACPLLHVFHHRGHGSGSESSTSSADPHGAHDGRSERGPAS